MGDAPAARSAPINKAGTPPPERCSGARLERLHARGNMSGKARRPSFGMVVNDLCDLDKVEASHAECREGEVARSRSIKAPA